ncbi:uracil-xanthine permease family protein [Christensenellaceae bacterium OttesenSCG-928-L17]|nr:uracil-xanthine permease family protein [Christensenellaceae bacterium OttesenSCG-928-L17]
MNKPEQAVNRKDAIFQWKGFAGLHRSLPLALQHVVAMTVGCVTPALVISGSGVCNLTMDERTLLVQSALFIAAIATLLQLFPIGKRIGAGLPVIMGVSFAYLPTLQSIGIEFGIGAIFGAELIGGLVAVLVGIFIKRLRPLFPPLVSGTVVFVIGLSLYPTAIRYMAGGAGAADFGAPVYWLVAGVTLLIVLVLNHFTKGFVKLASLLIGMLGGYLFCLLLDAVGATSTPLVDFTPIANAAWLSVPQVLPFGMEFHGTAIASMVIMYVVNSVQSIGDLSATTGGAMDREPTDKELSGGIIGNGVSSVLGAFLGGLPTATYSQNVGIVTVTKVINRAVLALASLLILVAALIPKIASALTTIPQSVLGGATITVFASITMTGMRLITSEPMSYRTISIIGLSVALGQGIVAVQGALAGFPAWVGSVFGSSSVVISTLTAVVMNLVLPKERVELKEVKSHKEHREE